MKLLCPKGLVAVMVSAAMLSRPVLASRTLSRHDGGASPLRTVQPMSPLPKRWESAPVQRILLSSVVAAARNSSASADSHSAAQLPGSKLDFVHPGPVFLRPHFPTPAAALALRVADANLSLNLFRNMSWSTPQQEFISSAMPRTTSATDSVRDALATSQGVLALPRNVTLISTSHEHGSSARLLLASSERSAMKTLRPFESVATSSLVLEQHEAKGAAKGREVFVGLVLLTLSLSVLACLLLPSGQQLPPDLDTSSQVSGWVESLSILSGEDLARQFQARSGYDCLIQQPQVTSGPVRLEGRTFAPPHALLCAPFARRPCLIFSSSACEMRLDNVRAPPVAFDAGSADFELEVSASGGKEVQRISIRGRDVALFAMVAGRRREDVALEEAPEHLQDFVRGHRCSGPFPGSAAVLEFAECILDAGALVTCVGERSAHGVGRP